MASTSTSLQPIPVNLLRWSLMPRPQKLRDADIVLAVVSTALSEACRRELDASRTIPKPAIVMTDPMLAAKLEPYFGPDLVVVDPVHPDRTELGIVQHLKTIDTGQQSKKALIALGTLALGS